MYDGMSVLHRGTLKETDTVAGLQELGVSGKYRSVAYRAPFAIAAGLYTANMRCM